MQFEEGFQAAWREVTIGSNNFSGWRVGGALGQEVGWYFSLDSKSDGFKGNH
jgi:hypothetical protein